MQLITILGIKFSAFSDTAVSNFFNYFTMPIPIPGASPKQIGTSKNFGVVKPSVLACCRIRHSEPIKVSSLVRSLSSFSKAPA